VLKLSRERYVDVPLTHSVSLCPLWIVLEAEQTVLKLSSERYVDVRRILNVSTFHRLYAG